MSETDKSSAANKEHNQFLNRFRSARYRGLKSGGKRGILVENWQLEPGCSNRRRFHPTIPGESAVDRRRRLNRERVRAYKIAQKKRLASMTSEEVKAIKDKRKRPQTRQIYVPYHLQTPERVEQLKAAKRRRYLKMKRLRLAKNSPSASEPVESTHMFKCDKCKFSTKTLGALKIHTKSTNKTYKCSIAGCSYTDTSVIRLAQHVDHQAHRLPDNTAFVLYNCTKCDYVTSIRAALGRHEHGVHGGEVMAVSSTEFEEVLVEDGQDKIGEPAAQGGITAANGSPDDQDDRNDPEEQDANDPNYKHEVEDTVDGERDGDNGIAVHKIENEEYPLQHNCPRCSFTSPHRYGLWQHSRTNHLPVRLFNCDECPFTTWNINKIASHKQKRHGVALPFACTQCEFAAKRRSELVVHVMSHTGERPFKCDFCDYATTTSSNAKKHIRAVHTGERPYKCDFCDYHSTTKSNVQKHMRSVHTDEKPFKCDECDFTSNTITGVTKHMMLHTGEKPFKCDECDYATTSMNNVDKHMRSVHSGEKKELFNCDMCSYVSTMKRFITLHERSVHGIQIDNITARFPCDICTYSNAKSAASLAKHKESHDLNRKFRCDRCPYAAKRRREFTQHMRTHTGEMPFKCDECDYASNLRGTLRKHIQAMHIGDPSAEFRCSYCSYAANQVNLLRRHENKVHRWITEGDKPGTVDGAITVKMENGTAEDNCTLVATSELNCMQNDQNDIKIKIEHDD